MTVLGLETAIRLPFNFDVTRLQRDLETAETFQFSRHPLRYHDGNWEAINLIYAGGRNEYTHAGTLGYGDEPPAKTEVLRQCPYFDEVIGALPGRVKMARLSALRPGGCILRHHDPVESIDFGQMRIHIPIRNDPDKVVFHLAFRRRRWRPGEVWYGDFTFPHSVHNRAQYTRVNMIVDVDVDESVLELFPKGYMGSAAKNRRERFRQEIRGLSWQISRIQSRLRSTRAETRT